MYVRFKTALAVAVALGAASSAVSAEAQVPFTDDLHPSPAADGWTNPVGSFDTIATGTNFFGHNWLAPPDGNTYAGGTQYGLLILADAEVLQKNITGLVSGRQYTVSWDMMADRVQGLGISDVWFDVSFCGTERDSIHIPFSEARIWSRQNMAFTANATSCTLRFRARNPLSNNSNWVFLDSVNVRDSCGNGLIETAEGCDDGNVVAGDGCSSTCTVETGFGCVPSLYATGVSDVGEALPQGSVDPHWTWSTSMSGVGAVPAIARRNAAWSVFAPGQWSTPTTNFGNELTTEPDTFWFQTVEFPAAFVGLTIPIVVACDNECEVFVNGVSYGGHNTFTSTATISVPSSAFVAGTNTVTVRLREGTPGTPRGILIYPGGGGILSQCTRRCTTAAECDDGIACTTNACVSSACSFTAAPIGTTCAGGVCNGDTTAPICVACADSSAMGTDSGCMAAAPHCRTSGAAAPVCEACIDSGMSGVDLGCGAATPNCVVGVGGRNSCVACLSAAECNDSNTCTTDSCAAGMCIQTPVTTGTTCAAGVCSAAGTCVTCTDTAAEAGVDSGCTAAAPLCLGSGALATCNACADTGMGGTDLGCTTMSPVCGNVGGAAVCLGCVTATDCADTNACTTEACVANRCEITGIAAGFTGACADMNVCTGPGSTPPNTCVQCVADAQCSGATAFCDVATHVCGPCERDFGGAGDGAACPEATPLCALTGPTAGICGRCATNVDCVGNPNGTVCDTTSGACGDTCIVDSDCAMTEWCPASGVCAPRVPNGMSVPAAGPANGMCTMSIGTRTCISGVCFEADDLCGLPNGEACTGAGVCRSAICAPNGLCGACDGNDDCEGGTCNVATGTCSGNDAGVGNDAGPRSDAGPVDAGGTMTADSGAANTDAGRTTGGIAGGACGCAVNTTKSSSGLFAMLGMLGLVMARRRRAR